MNALFKFGLVLITVGSVALCVYGISILQPKPCPCLCAQHDLDTANEAMQIAKDCITILKILNPGVGFDAGLDAGLKEPQ